MEWCDWEAVGDEGGVGTAMGGQGHLKNGGGTVQGGQSGSW